MPTFPNVEMDRIPRLAITGTSSGVGKSLITMGLVVAFRKRGLKVSCAVTGSRLQQAVILHRLTRRPCATLDPRMLSKAALVETMRICGDGADIFLIDGAGGCFDGSGRPPQDAFSGSNGEVIRATETPAVLVADLSILTSSLAALVHGYTTFDRRLSFSAVVGSRSPSADDPMYFRDLLDCFQLPTFVGHLPTLKTKADLPKMASELVNQTTLPVQLLVELGTLIEEHVDLDELIRIAKNAPPLSNQGEDLGIRKKTVSARLAVADDLCFGLCYQDNLALLRYLGCELIRFSPLADSDLPPGIGGVYLTGGFLDCYSGELAANAAMLASIRSFADQGGVVFAEGSGAALMCRRVTPSSGQSFAGAGLLPAEAFIRSSEAERSVEIELGEDSILGDPGERVSAHQSPEWEIGNLEDLSVDRIHEVFRMTAPDGRILTEGYSPTGQSLITSHLLHLGSNPRLALSLAGAIAVASRR